MHWIGFLLSPAGVERFIEEFLITPGTPEFQAIMER
jgi:hypothetical protein